MPWSRGGSFLEAGDDRTLCGLFAAAGAQQEHEFVVQVAQFLSWTRSASTLATVSACTTRRGGRRLSCICSRLLISASVKRGAQQQADFLISSAAYPG